MQNLNDGEKLLEEILLQTSIDKQLDYLFEVFDKWCWDKKYLEAIQLLEAAKFKKLDFALMIGIVTVSRWIREFLNGSYEDYFNFTMDLLIEDRGEEAAKNTLHGLK